MKTEIIDEKEEPSDSIVASLPLFDRELDTDSITSRFTIEDYVVREYESARDWESKLSDKIFPVLSLGYLLLFASVITFENIYRPSSISTVSIYVAIVTTSTILLLLLWSGGKIFKRIANKQEVDHDEAIYHRLVRSIEEYENGNIENSMEELNQAGELIEYKISYPFSPEFTRELYSYIRKVDEKDSENFYRSTFPEVGNKTLQALSSVYTSDMEYVYTERTELEQAERLGPSQMLKSYFGDLGKNRYVRMIGPYVILAPFIYGVYLENRTMAQILAILIVGLVQTYNGSTNKG